MTQKFRMNLDTLCQHAWLFSHNMFNFGQLFIGLVPTFHIKTLNMVKIPAISTFYSLFFRKLIAFLWTNQIFPKKSNISPRVWFGVQKKKNFCPKITYEVSKMTKFGCQALSGIPLLFAFASIFDFYTIFLRVLLK